MVVWSGLRTSKWIDLVDEEDIQPNGVDLKIDRMYILRGENIREEVKPENDRFVLYGSLQYVCKLMNFVEIPQGVCAIFLPRSSMWRKKGLIIIGSLFDTGYTGVPEIFVKPTFDVTLRKGERIGQIVYMDAEDTFPYNGQYKESKVKLNVCSA